MKHIAFFLPSLTSGGAQKVTLNKIEGFLDKNYKVDLVLSKARGKFLDQLPSNCRVIDLNCSKVFFSLFKLKSYLKEERPEYLISGLNNANCIAILSQMISGVNTKIIPVVHSTFSRPYEKQNIGSKIIKLMANHLFNKSHKVVAVSRGVYNDLVTNSRIRKHKITVIYNPLITNNFFQKINEPINHRWFDENIPIIISIGRLDKVKNYEMLIKAFIEVRKKMKCRLVIIGEGEEREYLNSLVKGQNLENEIWMPGFVSNPYKFVNKADLFVLTSRREGLPSVLVEALGCGTPVISTKSTEGVIEVLKNGELGKLVPLDDLNILVKEMEASLKSFSRYNNKAEELRVKEVNKYRIDNCIDRYLEIMSG